MAEYSLNEPFTRLIRPGWPMMAALLTNYLVLILVYTKMIGDKLVEFNYTK
jgi:hypothetical protein